MSSSSRIDDMFVSLPLTAKLWISVWTYLAVGGWFSTYMLIREIDEAWRNKMFETLIPEDAFVWTVIVMMISSFVVIGLLFYGRYNRKKKEVVKEAVKRFQETGTYTDPNMKFDLSVIPFWIGGSVLNVLFSLCVLVVAVEYTGAELDPSVMYVLAGFGVSFFMSILMYLVTEIMVNGVLDAKSVKKFLVSVVGAPETKKIVGMVCTKFSIADQETVDRIYEKVKGKILAKNYSELTPDEIILVNKAIEEARCGI